MRLRNRSAEQRAEPFGAASESDEQEVLRDRGAALLAAADKAISRVLSRDSVEFLEQNTQAGGQ